MAGTNLRVPVPTVRMSISPERLHKAIKASDGVPSTSRHQDDLLPGRHSTVESGPERIAAHRQDDMDATQSLGVRDKQGKVETNPGSTDRVLRHDSELPDPNHATASGEDREDQVAVYPSITTERSQFGNFRN